MHIITNSNKHIYTNMHTCTHAHMHEPTQTCMGTEAHGQTHMYTCSHNLCHIYIYIYIYKMFCMDLTKAYTYTSECSENTPCKAASGGVQHIGSLTLSQDTYSSAVSCLDKPKSAIFKSFPLLTRMLRQATSR